MSLRAWAVVAVLLLGLLAGAAVLWREEPAPAGTGEGGAPRPIVFLGDSITSGHRLPRSVAFPDRIGRALGVPVVNAGVSGDTTAGGLARLEDDVLHHRPRLVVVELGVNDAFRGVPPAETAGNLREITRRLRAAGARVVLLHIRLPRPAATDGGREALRAIAREEGATLVEDFLDGVVPGQTYDGLHPDERGQARLAEQLLPVVREALGARAPEPPDPPARAAERGSRGHATASGRPRGRHERSRSAW